MKNKLGLWFYAAPAIGWFVGAAAISFALSPGAVWGSWWFWGPEFVFVILWVRAA